MSTLWTAVKARYDEQALLELTNLRDTTAVAIDDAQGERAVLSVVAFFPVYVQEAFDETDDGHLAIACEGVVAQLFKWGGSTHRIAETTWDAWKQLCAEWKSTHARARIVPVTSVPTTLVSSDAPTTPHTPWSDPERFTGLLPNRAGPVDSDGEDA